MSELYKSPTEYLLCDVNNRVLTITLNRPEAMNALRPEMFDGIKALVTQAEGDSNIAVIVLEGAGRAFSAGVDLKVLQGFDPKAGKIGDIFDKPAAEAWDIIRKSRCPVIAKVHGACFTGALEMALHCDFIFTTVDTKFGDTHAKFGLRPTWGMSQTLSQAIGVRKAKELSFSARIVLGEEAVKLGIANAAEVDKEALDSLVNKRSSQISSNSQEAVKAFKDLYGLSQSGLSIDDALKAELENEFPEINDTNERLADFK
ncbi:enoyl-CoA hydratase/isomerase family protein [Hyphomicrobiales bacterium]|jgi:enoyl-CoA hydratase/carnithine racemase|nr:enoyl-CoA hydratase/isomerase family protein [Hyphomicrobiales bacterium]|tara:strand:- start:648 stop:1424 length:777 start_codon:yes stop_codon:yes gene_type:complete